MTSRRRGWLAEKSSDSHGMAARLLGVRQRPDRRADWRDTAAVPKAVRMHPDHARRRRRTATTAGVARRSAVAAISRRDAARQWRRTATAVASADGLPWPVFRDAAHYVDS